MIDPAEIQEVRLLIRFVASELSDTERAALTGFLADMTDRQVAEEIGIKHPNVWLARERALKKMRMKFRRLGIKSTADLLSKK